VGGGVSAQQCNQVIPWSLYTFPKNFVQLARMRGTQLTAGPVRTQQKTSALGKPDADLFIARTY